MFGVPSSNPRHESNRACLGQYWVNTTKQINSTKNARRARSSITQEWNQRRKALFGGYISREGKVEILTAFFAFIISPGGCYDVPTIFFFCRKINRL
ncbi:hypothetical protein QE152_g30199 [Popillia japonica]|uniref:Uncharacterized protein n=1 Tax=Popillia japonica TaxID=7064 RepID=A0AAW1JF42_POPJA